MIKHAIYVALSALLASIALTSNAHALEQIIRPYQGVRSSAMGGVKLTTGIYDENFYGNAARAAANPNWRVEILDFMAETSPSTIDTIGDLTGGGDTLSKIGSASGKNIHGRIQTSFPAWYWPNALGGKNSFAVGLLSSTQFDVDLRKSYQLDPNAITDIGPSFTYARKLLPDDALSVGVTSHLTYRLASKSDFSFIDLIRGASLSPLKSGGEGAHIDFDLGSTYRLPWKLQGWDIDTAVAFNNLLGGNYSNFPMHIIKTGLRPPQQPRTLGFGGAFHKDQLWKFDNALLALEFTDIGNNPDGSLFRLVHLGGELTWGVLSPRLGINQGYFTGGLGIDLKAVELELTTYGEEMSLNVGGFQDRRYAAKLSFHI